MTRLAGRAIVSVQNPVVLADDSEPQPDLEYWVVDCVAESVEIHRTPHAGGYRDVIRVTDAGATVSPQAFPDVTLTLAKIFA